MNSVSFELRIANDLASLYTDVGPQQRGGTTAETAPRTIHRRLLDKRFEDNNAAAASHRWNYDVAVAVSLWVPS